LTGWAGSNFQVCFLIYICSLFLDRAEFRISDRLCGDGHGAGEQDTGPGQGSRPVNHIKVPAVPTVQLKGQGREMFFIIPFIFGIMVKKFCIARCQQFNNAVKRTGTRNFFIPFHFL
jgi:hypothetical protein